MTGLRNRLERRTSEKVSTLALYLLVALTVVLFGAFFLIGYDTPYEDDPSFNAPVLTDAVLVFIYLLVFATLALTVASVIAGSKPDKTSTSYPLILAAPPHL